MRALLVAGHSDERAVLSLVLQRAGLLVTATADLEPGAGNWVEQPPDLVVIALSGDQRTHVRRARLEADVPLLLVADRLDEDLHCELLEAGADIVFQRPYGPRLLLAQVRALMRRGAGVRPTMPSPLEGAGLTLDPVARTVARINQPLRRLTQLEFRLLHTLMTHRGQTLPTEVIVERVWGYSGRGDNELVRGLIARLRAKVEPDRHNPTYIITQPGVGYAFDPQEGSI